MPPCFAPVMNVCISGLENFAHDQRFFFSQRKHDIHKQKNFSFCFSQSRFPLFFYFAVTSRVAVARKTTESGKSKQKTASSLSEYRPSYYAPKIRERSFKKHSRPGGTCLLPFRDCPGLVGEHSVRVQRWNVVVDSPMETNILK